jgi:PAS domain-containing protein
VKFFRSALGRYVTALGAFGVATAFSLLLRNTLGGRFTGYPFLYLIAIMLSASRGYGPGILVTLAATSLAPYLLIPDFTLARIDLNRTGLALLVSILISRVYETRARSEHSLRKITEELDQRVQLRTEELERSNAALRESEERFRLFMRHLPGAAWMKGLNGRYVYVNPSLETIFHTSLEQVLGRICSWWRRSRLRMAFTTRWFPNFQSRLRTELR